MVEVSYIGLLVVAFAATAWLAFAVAVKLFKGQG